jgi:hypothetical protein
MKINFKVVLVSLLVVACAVFFGYTAFRTVTKNQQLHAEKTEKNKANKAELDANGAKNLEINLLANGQKFDSLDLNLVGRCVITQGDEFSFRTSLDSDKINLKFLDGNTELKVSMRENGNFNFGDDDWYFEITLPSLKSINLDGAGEYEISGFSGEELALKTKGAGAFNFEDFDYKTLKVDQSGLGSLQIDDSTFENANLELSGAGELDLEDSVVTNAVVNQSGLGQIVLTLGGGSISGSLSGLGQIICYGEVGSKNITVTGLGKIDFKD